MIERANTLEEVIANLDTIIDISKTENRREAYFAVLYKLVTLTVQERCEAGLFEDNARMEKLDVIFANRYFDAWQAFHNNDEHLSLCWEVAFRACKSRWALVLQHLLLGMNAHIGLDLGVAVSEVSGGTLDESLRRDFDTLNDILAELTGGVQAKIGAISPYIGFLDRLGGESDTALVTYNMKIARDTAWAFAEQLTCTTPASCAAAIKSRDRTVARYSMAMYQPSFPVSFYVFVISLFEKRNVGKVIQALVGED
ncbi:MAG: DUF5995 family protein [Aggregatilineales bacterium]